MIELPNVNYSAKIDNDEGFFFEVEVYEDFTYINYFEKEEEKDRMVREIQIPTNYAKQIANVICALGKQFP